MEKKNQSAGLYQLFQHAVGSKVKYKATEVKYSATVIRCAYSRKSQLISSALTLHSDTILVLIGALTRARVVIGEPLRTKSCGSRVSEPQSSVCGCVLCLPTPGLCVWPSVYALLSEEFHQFQ